MTESTTYSQEDLNYVQLLTRRASGVEAMASHAQLSSGETLVDEFTMLLKISQSGFRRSRGNTYGYGHRLFRNAGWLFTRSNRVAGPASDEFVSYGSGQLIISTKSAYFYSATNRFQLLASDIDRVLLIAPTLLTRAGAIVYRRNAANTWKFETRNPDDARRVAIAIQELGTGFGSALDAYPHVTPSSDPQIVQRPPRRWQNP